MSGSYLSVINKVLGSAGEIISLIKKVSPIYSELKPIINKFSKYKNAILPNINISNFKQDNKPIKKEEVYSSPKFFI